MKSAIQKTPSRRIFIGGQRISIGRADGNVSITISVMGDWSNVTLSKTSNISADIYGTKSYGNTKLALLEKNINSGYVYLKFSSSATASSYYETGKPCCINISDQLYIDLS